MGDLTTGLLTRRIEKIDPPYADYPPWVKTFVIQAFAAAWQRLVEQEPALVSEEAETEITACLQMLLNDLRREAGNEAAGFSGSLFETVTREGSEVNYNGVRLEKKPDLVIRLPGLHPGLENSQFRAIFVECKLVSRSHPVRNYCKHGVSRFVNGDYAWSMPSAMMVAYARDSLTVETALTPHLAQHQRIRPIRHLCPSIPAP